MIVAAFFVFALSALSGLQPVTFNREVAPILYENCTVCHRQGEVAPFPLVTYADAKKRAKLISEITGRRIMPPWKAKPDYGHFEGERRLSASQIATLKRWAESGAPEGRPAAKPVPPAFPTGWRLGKPDLILKMPKPFSIPADGKDVYRNFVLPVSLPKDTWVRGAEFHPGNAKIVHHVIVLTDTSGKARELDLKDGNPNDGYSGYSGMGFLPSGALGGFSPGDTPKFNVIGTAGKLEKKTEVVFSMHYHPSGKPETDQSEIGIYFTNTPPTRRGSVLLMGVLNVDIDPGDAHHTETAEYELPCNLEITGINPHMHLIGKESQLWAETPDGKKTPMIWVNDWDINWQGTYRLKTPLKLSKGTKLKGRWVHDNSADNPHNPNLPPKRVKNGENSTDEMAGAIVEVVVDSWQDELALWGANLGAMARAYFTPAVKSAKK